MRLKALTTALMVLGVALLLSWPWTVGPRPPSDSTVRARAEWGSRALVLFGVTTTVWIVIAGLAVLVGRQARREFLEQSRENLKALMEESLKDHGRDR